MSAEHTLSGKHIVVTGFTGFLAKVLVALILEEVPHVGRISLLVRPRGRLRPALRRVEEIVERSPAFRRLRQHHGAHLETWLGARLAPIDADLEAAVPVTADALEQLRGADVLIHCAGLTDFAPDPLKALSANTRAAASVASLAETLGVPMVHVSTCYAAGVPRGAPVEEALEPGVAPHGQRFDVGSEIRALQLACRQGEAPSSVSARIDIGMARAEALGWPNIYTYTKGLAEHLLAQRPDLDLTIVRPAIVECARSFPLEGWNEGLNTAGPLAWLISTAFRRLPTTPDHRFDVVPVDDVAKGLGAIAAAAIRGEAGGVFHLASSDHNPFTFERAVELTGLGMRRWSRQHGTPTDKLLLANLDPIPVPASRPGPFAVDKLASWLPGLRRALGSERHRWLPEGLEPSVGARLDQAASQLGQAESQVSRVQEMLDLFKPFIHDYDWVFRTDRIRALTQTEPTFRFDLTDLCWRRYWVDVEYPGLRTWCIPLIDGQDAPTDPPLEPRFRLRRAALPDLRVASK